MENILLTPDEIKKLLREELRFFFAENKLLFDREEERDYWFDLRELCNYLPDKPKPSTVYGWINKCQIPYHKKTKKLSFLKSEIDAWLKAGRRKTMSEISSAANLFLQAKRKGS